MKRLFNCPKCAKQPDKAFGTYEKFNDWWIAYPEDSVIHIHYGESTHSEVDNTKESQDLRDFILKTLEKYPDKKFFLIADFETLDSSEAVSGASMRIFINILKSQQIAGLSVYGSSADFSVFVKQLISIFSKVSLVDTYKEAEAMYQKWFSTV